MSTKDHFKRWVARHPLLVQSMYHFYRLRNASAAAEIEARAKLSLFDYRALAAPLPYYPQERIVDNNIYGYAIALKKFSRIENDLEAYMEHGLFLGGIVHPDQHHWHFPRIITMSNERLSILQRVLPHKQSIAVGPYIHYTNPHYGNSSYKKIKQKLGKCLLVYPFHSMKNVSAEFSDAEFAKEIKQVAKNFHSVLVCLYYLDAQVEKRVAYYRSEGFEVVCAGHKFDPNFVARQRAHIELADFTMSNGVGTQTGFCLYLGKPHYIFSQTMSQKAHSQRQAKRVEKIGSREAAAQQRAEISQAMSELSDHITPAQHSLIARQWGFDDIKTAAQLLEIFAD